MDAGEYGYVAWGQVMTKTWVKLRYNMVLSGDGFYVSYNPGEGPLAPDDGKPETALVIKNVRGPTFLILNGDFRKEFENLIDQGCDACRMFYEIKKVKDRSSWSEDQP